ncbi:ABC transporter permease [Jonesia denitrificans]|uniref:Monosaccharide-transporting ATPase n=1 Tax=Jonesia denitrificans (strain ATCC 14870 / DSM 20603 / BCRC 15368 / CIP 55.134 / JCM 11481 / NBRC 15587 / NCTC 10816 / Prevot 55134) TaxID=471856 RepID=C7QZ45_JONDD|nr:ABC transporter permease [Jonesia denitrificans]ACV07953.1 Monosaccharide-transporting ATPase [Jonesia denitrificans DSM 20603]ASE08352.1 ABC transporter permease [Jonesia denitrificans]QXB42952.1 ABC transporter permease [Jonesia denitrificans]SQH19927.1 Inner membrane ABC transporter permease protein ytfT [Jonesia denitrificans]
MRDLGARVSQGVKDVLKKQYVWGVLAIVLLLAINLAKDPTYLSITVSESNGHLVGNVIDILRAAAPIMMIAIGMCLVVATSGIDLSVGSLMVVAGAVSMELLNGADNTVGAAAQALVLALAIATALGFLNGFLVSVVGLQPFISTLVMMLAGRGLAKVITGGQNTSSTNDTFRWLANGYVLGVPVVFILAVLVAVVVAFVVRRSALGLMIEAIGMDPQAARLAGINRRGLLLMVYATSGVLAGIAGVFATASVMTVDVSRTGYQMELDAILAVVIGGTSLAGGKFHLSGAFVGSLLIATLDKTVVFLGVSSSATPAFKAIVIVVLCLLQSQRVRSVFRRRRRAQTGAVSESKELVGV